MYAMPWIKEWAAEGIGTLEKMLAADARFQERKTNE